MTLPPDGTTCDGFLNGRLQILQPVSGYRAATDPVFLAAAVPARAGQTILELGCGVGVASLCLGWRVGGLQQVGVEIQTAYADLACLNVTRNNGSLSVVQADIQNLPRNINAKSFDHVMFNPPFFDTGSVTLPDDSGKTMAHVENAGLQNWLHIALKRLRPRGRLTVIHLSEKLPEILAGLDSKTGDVYILPLASRPGRAAKRVIVSARKGTAGPARLLAPFIVHSGASHDENGSDFSPRASAVLRDGLALDMT